MADIAEDSFPLGWWDDVPEEFCPICDAPMLANSFCVNERNPHHN